MQEIEDAIIIDDYEKLLEVEKSTQLVMTPTGNGKAALVMAQMMAMAGSAITSGGSAMEALGLNIPKGKTSNKYTDMPHCSGAKEIARRKTKYEKQHNTIS